MINRLAAASLAALAFLALSRPTLADPLSISLLPEQTKWVIHLDIDAGRGTPIHELIRTRFIEPHRAEVESKTALIRTVTGMDFPAACHDITLYGAGYDESGVCVLIHGDLNQDTTLAHLKLNDDFAITLHQGHDIYAWRDSEKNRMMYGTFLHPGLAVISADEKAVELASDVADGKAPCVKTGMALAPESPDANAPATPAGAPMRTILYAAARNMADLKRVQPTASPLLAQVDTAKISLGMLDQDFAVRTLCSANSDDEAKMMVDMVTGMKAYLGLAAAASDAPARAKLASVMLQNLSIKADGRVVRTDWTIGMDKITALVDTMQAAAAAPPNPTPRESTSPSIPAATLRNPKPQP